MRSTKACLFGGALLAAGMSAQAQEFILLDGSSDGQYASFAYSYSYGGSLDAAYAPDPLNTSDTGYTAYAGTTTTSTFQSNAQLLVQGSWAGDGYIGYGFGTAFIQQFFQVTEDAQLLIEWNLASTDGDAVASLLAGAGGAQLFLLDPGAGDPLVGSALIDVQAGVEYAAIIDFYPFIYSANDPQSISITVVPTPGTGGLLAAGGLLATRRRRR